MVSFIFKKIIEFKNVRKLFNKLLHDSISRMAVCNYCIIYLYDIDAN